jgi:cell division protein FtsL
MPRRAATATAARTAPARVPRHRPEPRRQPRRTPPPRRRSGAARVVSLPLRIARAPAGQSLRGRIAGIADALLHGRGWIVLVAVLLVGIVFFNVDLLQMNREIAQTADKAATVKRANARLKLRLARLDSTERIQRAAQQRGLVLPLPGQIRYLRTNRVLDGRRAARRIGLPNSGQAPIAAPTTPTPPPAQAPGAALQQPAAAQPQSVPQQAAPQQQATPQAQQQQPQQQPQQAQPTPQPAPKAGPTGAPAAPAGAGG